MDTQERRRDIRARIALPVCLVRRGSAEPVKMTDASFRGLFLRLDAPPPVRSLVKLRVQLPSRELEVHGVVVRVVQDPTGGVGVGLRFFALNGQDRSDWDAFIASALARLQGQTRAA